MALPSGTTLYRVHKKAYSADGFSPVLSHRYYGGGRFDATLDDQYSFLYAGQTLDVAIVETLLRDFDYDAKGNYILPRSVYAGRRFSAVATVGDLELVGMRTRSELSSFKQSPWITHAPPAEYAQTRHWGHWIRSKAPTAAGYVWHSRQEPELRSYVFFGDRLAGRAIEVVDDPNIPSGSAADFDTEAGLMTLRELLEPYGVTVEDPLRVDEWIDY
ncbi:RES family NAD+ phosphorylase [Arthrobacter sp. 31Y]|uniref:RES family NAD+ phosphorylase n=1 Tax=Arthrobacter sp. 31Y TaxID=1115632 RepID=UPI00163A435C|nr:RES family NAD+ phosphorylase [Arthrobacter sp. 31Y]